MKVSSTDGLEFDTPDDYTMFIQVEKPQIRFHVEHVDGETRVFFANSRLERLGTSTILVKRLQNGTD